MDVRHLTTEELEAGMERVRLSPKDEGVLELIVRRPRVDEREVLEEGQLSLVEGLVGDSWKQRGSSRTPDGSPHPDMQLNVMNARVLALVAQDRERWRLAGDQLIIDLDLSDENLPAGTRLSLGSAVIEVTDQPHTGCHKFVARFGLDAMRFVNSPAGKRLRLRGLNARVVRPGVIRAGDVVRKLRAGDSLAGGAPGR
ncbi:MAG: MOSC domain-containing protein [Acidobacteriota bacterium]|nr:MOSC domain-containing protein [Acidobacteriota bacterium]